MKIVRNTMRAFRRLCLRAGVLGVFVFLLGYANGQTVQSSRVNNFSDQTSAINAEVPWFSSDMLVNANWATLYRNDDVFAKVELGIDYSEQFDVTTNEVIEVDLSIDLTDQSNTTTNQTKTISIDFDNTVTNQTNDHSVIFFDDAFKISVEITAIRVNGNLLATGVSPGQYVYLKVLESAKRVWEMSPSAVVDINTINITDNTLAKSNFVIAWDPIDEASSYELEWTFIDFYALDVAPHSNPHSGLLGFPTLDVNTTVNYAFSNNSSRVRLSETSFTLPSLYERGYLVFRVRPVGYDIFSSSSDIEVQGDWTIADEGTFQYFSGGSRQDEYAILVDDLDQTRTWQSALAFAEEGKLKQSVSYFDESMRMRQMISRLNTVFDDNGTLISVPVVGQSIYDNQGRPSLSVLPTPTKDDLTLNYREDFVQYDNSGTAENYSWEHFDLDNTAAVPMSTASGPAKYYSSSNNFDRVNHTYNNVLPNAQGYPFTQTEYTPDNTGRIRRQGGVGLSHQLGSGHESFYYYSTPFQEELFRIFGNDIGIAGHYEKNAVEDANGQVSVSYLDAAGRVIATALVGDPDANAYTPISDNTESWAGASGANQMSVEIPEVRRIEDGDVNSIIAEKTFFVSYPKDYIIDYDITVGTYNDQCLPSTLCFDCVYDLIISVVDQDGVQYIPSGTGPNGEYVATVGSISQAPDPCSTGVLSFDVGGSGINLGQLPKGTYTIVKKLTVSKDAMEHYLDEFMTNNQCLLTIEDFITEERNTIDLTGCDDYDCSTCQQELADLITASLTDLSIKQEDIDAKAAICDRYCYAQTPCDILKTQMISDVVPGGQYAPYEYEDVNGDLVNAYDNLWTELSYSLLNPYKSNGIHYRNPVDESGNATNYKNADGSMALILQVNGFPAITGSSYYDKDGNTWTSGERYILPQDIADQGAFIAFFKHEWAEQLIYYHPEYCRYEGCIAIEESYDYDNLLLSTESGEQALTQGMFENLSTCSTPGQYTVVPNPTGDDPLFTSLFGVSNASATTMCNNMLNVHSIGQNIWDFSYLYSNHSGTQGCTPDEQWILYRSMYLSLKQDFYVTYYDGLTCDPDAVVASRFDNTMTLADFDKRFLYKQADLNDPRTSLGRLGVDATNPTALTSSAYSAILVSECQSDCEAYAMAWMGKMEGCQWLTAAQKQILIDELIDVCKSSCNDGNGARRAATTATANGNSSFTEAFKWFEATYSIPLTESCNPLLVDYPGPPGYEYFEREYDQCFCDKLDSVEVRYNNSQYPATICNLEEAFMYEYGIYIEDWQYAKCYCEFLNNPSFVPTSEDSCYDFYLNNLDYPVGCDNGISADGKIIESFFNYLINNPVGEGVPTSMASYFPAFYDVSTYSHTAQSDPCLLQFTRNVTIDTSTGTEVWTITITDNCGFSCVLTLTYHENDPQHAQNFGSVTNISFENYNGSLLVNSNLNWEVAWLTLDQSCFDILCAKVYIPPTTYIDQELACDVCWECCEYKDFKLEFYRHMGYDLEVYLPDYKPEFYSLFSLYLKEKYNLDFTDRDLLDFENECIDSGYCIDLDTTFEYLNIASAYQLEGQWYFITDPQYTDSNLVVSNCPCEPAPASGVPVICENWPEVEEDPCSAVLEYQADMYAYQRYERYIQAVEDQFRKDYVAHCMQPVENLGLSYDDMEYHFTLYYYDQGNNLVKTVPPAGVDFVHFTQTQLDSRIANAKAHASNSANPFEQTDHKLNTYYMYNTLGQIATQNTPDGNTTNFWYDDLGRLVVSQNDKQEPNDEYSYTLYDDLGRIKEVGQTTNTSAMSYFVSTNDIENNWLNTTREQVTVTIYNDRHNTSADLQNNFAGNTQQNLRNRVSSTLYIETYSNPAFQDYDKATHYSYDIHGNVFELVQENTDFSTSDAIMRYKKMEYDYDLISGNVNEVVYQRDKIDQFRHRYTYDADNRILEVYTATDPREWTLQANYIYYLHGPLARTELGELNVQGVDYAYTLHGWLKAINSGSMIETNDIGKDGDITPPSSSNPNAHFARDAFGVNLGYYSGDYSPINLSAPSFIADYSSSNMSSYTNDLFNGNIGHMVTAIPDQTDYTVSKTISASAQGYAYRYDRLNRIAQMTSYEISGNQWQNLGGASADLSPYYTKYKYDPNGNIIYLERNGEAGNLDMDELQYDYNKTYDSYLMVDRLDNNKLNYVDDNTSFTTNHTEDIDDMASTNFDYDALGNLIKDESERIATINWTVYGKIKEIIRDNSTPSHQKSDLVFEYDASGNRTVKIEKKRDVSGSLVSQSEWIYTYYVRDASGNIMANYSAVGDRVAWTSSELYGSSRLGSYNADVEIIDANGIVVSYTQPDAYEHTRGDIVFELSNHLGNVLAVVTDRKMARASTGSGNWDYFEVSYAGFSDYYPFGMLMENRSWSISSEGGSITVDQGASDYQKQSDGGILKIGTDSWYNPGSAAEKVSQGEGIEFYVVQEPGAVINEIATVLGLCYTYSGGGYSNIDYRMVYQHHSHRAETNIGTLTLLVTPLANGNHLVYQAGDKAGIERRSDGMIYFYVVRATGERIDIAYVADNNPSAAMTIKFNPYYNAATVYLKIKSLGEGYRFGFQGQEGDDEIMGNGNYVFYKYRVHNSRLAKFSSIDPLTHEYPYLTPYQFSSNQPIHARELEGLESENELSYSQQEAEVYNDFTFGLLDIVDPILEWIDECFFEEEKVMAQKEIASFKKSTPAKGTVSGSVYLEWSETTTTKLNLSDLNDNPGRYIDPYTGVVYGLSESYTETDFTINSKLEVSQMTNRGEITTGFKLSHSFISGETKLKNLTTFGTPKGFGLKGDIFNEIEYNLTTGAMKEKFGVMYTTKLGLPDNISTLGGGVGSTLRGVTYKSTYKIGLGFHL